ncbi:MAG: hypothetical protein K9L86_01925 [Candidatus Omnitrophica bacterium]|nr:hypothetical protein [Candidatus Omnitrophota bacterium]
MAKQNDTLKYMKEEVWPKTKKEVERGIKEAKKILNKSEKYLKTVSEKGVKQTKKVSLAIKKEKLYYDLGKTVACVKLENWSSNKKIEAILGEIKALDRKTARIK